MQTVDVATFEKAVADFAAIEAHANTLSGQVREACAIMERQRKVIELAIDELMSLYQTEAIPEFFRNQIAGTIRRMQEVNRS